MVWIFEVFSQSRTLMMRRIFTTALLFVAMVAMGQDKDLLFGTGEIKTTNKKGFIISVFGDADMPGADMAKRFGNSYRVGPAILYKTKTNWLFGVKFDFILGGIVRQDSLMINIRDKYSGQSTNLYEFMNNNGDRIGVPVYERGYATGIQFGKIISTSKRNPDNGVVLLNTVGFMQHKINIYDKDKSVYQLDGQYLKGYDRLTNGLFDDVYVGYIYFARNELLNFTLGVDAFVWFYAGSPKLPL